MKDIERRVEALERIVKGKKGVKMICGVLGFPIDRDVSCLSSGKHPLCKRCLGQEKEADEVQHRRARIRKKCGWCARNFYPKSNRQELCDKYGETNERLKNRERQGRFQKNQKNGQRLTV